MARQQFDTIDVIRLEVANAAGTGWIDITGTSVEISIEREFLQVGELHAILYDSTLDPATSTTLRPGRVVRLTTHANPASPTRFTLFTGKIREGEVTYEPRRPAAKRARIELSAIDATAELANAARPEGVATLEELPYVLAGTGVPWVINGNNFTTGNEVVVSRNDQASALDQIAITRDTVNGYAWVDQDGVLIAWSVAGWAGTPVAFTGADFNTYDMGFNTADCCNTVTVRVQQLDPVTGEATEVVHGPYVDQASIDEWGPYAETFTVHGLNTQAEIDAYAATVLAANATPTTTIRGLKAAVTRLTQLQHADSAATIDLGREITLGGLGFPTQIGIVSKISHTITTTKWLTEIGFLKSGLVASPVATPSVSTGGAGTTLAELLQPVGHVEMFYGAKADITPGWLAMDGSSFDGDVYPRLEAHLGGTTLPNMTDRFPIGAGTKALGTSGGDPTKTLVKANMPPQIDVTATGGASGGTTENGGVSVAQGAPGGRFVHPVTVNNGAAATPVDVMPPWRAMWFIIRAV